MERKRQASDHLVSLMYMTASVADLFLESILSRGKYNKDTWELKQEKKALFKQFFNTLKGASNTYEKMMDDLWKSCKNANRYQDLQWEHNFVARMLMLYYERFSHSSKLQSELMDYMMSNGERHETFSELDYEHFHLK